MRPRNLALLSIFTVVQHRVQYRGTNDSRNILQPNGSEWSQTKGRIADFSPVPAANGLFTILTPI